MEMQNEAACFLGSSSRLCKFPQPKSLSTGTATHWVFAQNQSKKAPNISIQTKQEERSRNARNTRNVFRSGTQETSSIRSFNPSVHRTNTDRSFTDRSPSGPDPPPRMSPRGEAGEERLGTNAILGCLMSFPMRWWQVERFFMVFHQQKTGLDVSPHLWMSHQKNVLVLDSF